MRRKNYIFQKEADEEEDINSEQEEENEEDEEDDNNIEDEEEEQSSDDSEAIIYENQDNEDNKNAQDNEVDEKITEEDRDAFNNYLFGLRSNIDEVTKKLTFLNSSLDSDKAEMGYGISYLDAKNNMMLVYLTNLIMYSTMKTAGQDIDDTDTVKQLIYIKTILERSKVIDLKIKSQIDRLIKLAERGGEGTRDTNQEVNDENLRVNLYLIFSLI
jgi:hypothetical protein